MSLSPEARKEDVKWMRKALRLAMKGLGRTSPNPAVGAVVVRDSEMIGSGFHEKAGGAHAEINAFSSLAEGDCAGATLYVTLEPCSTHGRTPPCVDAIIAKGIKRVVAGTCDPNTRHSGRGFEILNRAGIETACGILENECRELNESFFHWIQHGTPFVTLKMAMTLDGKIADHDGTSKWISGPLARRRVDFLRLCSDAVLVGSATALKDRPSLNVRTGKFKKTPRRLVATSSLSAEELAKILPPGMPPEPLEARSEGEWKALMLRLGAENVVSLLVEGGGELADSVLGAGVVNRVEFHIAPRILGGNASLPVVGGGSLRGLDSAVKLENMSVRRLGGDLIVRALV